MKRRGDLDSLRLTPPAKPTSFFKVILSDITPGSRLMIPPKFISVRGNDLKDIVFLRAPGGSVWQVVLERTDGEVRLRDGWPEFAANYSLCLGNFLVFRYEGNSTFYVIILDKSGAEIEYPLHTEQTYLSREYQKRREAATANDNFGSGKKLRNSYLSNDMLPEPKHMPSKKTEKVSAFVEAWHLLGLQENALITSNKTRIKDTDKPDNTCNLKVSMKSENLHSDGSTQQDRGKGVNRLTWVTSEADNGMLASAKASESKTSFRINMQPSYVSGKYSLNVPRKFVTEYITLDHCNVILQRSDGRSWAAECKVYPTMAKFGVGWRIFVEDNSLAPVRRKSSEENNKLWKKRDQMNLEVDGSTNIAT